MKAISRMMYYIKLLPYFVSRNVQSKMSYSVDFFLGIIANIMKQALGFIFVWVLFSNVPEVNGWNFNQMMFVYGMQAITLGLNEFMFAGTWKIAQYVQEGSLDRLLLRPVGTLFSVIAADVTFHGLGAAAFGLVICIISLVNLQMTLSVGMILFWILAIICGTLIYFSVNMWAGTLAFWIIDTGSPMMILQNVSEFSKYPVSIYGGGLQILLTFVLPFAFTSYYPTAFIFGMETGVMYWLGPVIAAALCLTIAVLFWRYGLTKYQSAGG
ncbi:MAG: ABC-2 family transporter protein [Lachnospiraceae bacterium]|nr:ABC-2 family transporter protein [Lachnospiraceae bacterium]